MIRANNNYRAYCCTHPNCIGSSRLWNNRPRPHSLGILAYIFAARKKITGRYFRERIFSREDIFAGRYFRVNSIFAKISSRENISNSLFAKFSSRENKVLYSNHFFSFCSIYTHVIVPRPVCYNVGRLL